jgi:type I restriction enzyme, R subunit
MPSQTNELALEISIEKRLTGTHLEAINLVEVANIAAERVDAYRSGHLYYIGHTSDFDAKYAIDTVRLWDFLEMTQKEELAKLQKHDDWRLKIKERLYDDVSCALGK